MSGMEDLFSDEALEAKLVDNEYDPPEANEVEMDLGEAPAADDAEVEAAPVEAEPVADGDKEPEAEADEGDERKHATRQDAEKDAWPQEEPEVDWQARHQHAEQLIGRQGQELGELRAQLAQMQSLIQQPQQQPQPDLAYAPQSVDDLLDMAMEDPDSAYDFASQHAPQFMPAVIAEIRAHDPVRAESMLMDFTMRVQEGMVNDRLSRLEQDIQQRTQPLANMQVQVERASAVDGVAQQHADWDQVKDTVAQIVRDNGQQIFKGSDAQAVAEGLEKAYWMAKAQRAESLLQAQQLQQQQIDQAAGQAAVVTQATPEAVPEPKETSVEDSIHDGIFEANQRLVW